jgi:RNA polymerase sigma factor (sigma-70 family)
MLGASGRRRAVRDDPFVVSLVERARMGEKDAWHEIVERYAPLLWAICRRYGLTRADTDDVGGSVWLRLVEHLATLREPAALPGWIATTTQRECLRVLRSHRKNQRLEDAMDHIDPADSFEFIEKEVLAEERNIALRTGFAELPPQCRKLLLLLMQDPPAPYSEIGKRLGLSVGSIGPTRARCLAKLRCHPALAAFIGSTDAQGR